MNIKTGRITLKDNDAKTNSIKYVKSLVKVRSFNLKIKIR